MAGFLLLLGVAAARLSIPARAALVFLIRLIPQPWRGILDLGLVTAFGWGFLSALIMGAMAVLGRQEA
jgi:hypothetical protein